MKKLQRVVLSNRRTRQNLLDTIWLDACKERGWNDQWMKRKEGQRASASEFWDICKGYCKEKLIESNKSQKQSSSLKRSRTIKFTIVHQSKTQRTSKPSRLHACYVKSVSLWMQLLVFSLSHLWKRSRLWRCRHWEPVVSCWSIWVRFFDRLMWPAVFDFIFKHAGRLWICKQQNVEQMKNPNKPD